MIFEIKILHRIIEVEILTQNNMKIVIMWKAHSIGVTINHNVEFFVSYNGL